MDRMVHYSERYVPFLIWALFAGALSVFLMTILGVKEIELATMFYYTAVWAAFFPSIYMLIAFMRYRYLVLAVTFAVLPVFLPGLGS